MSKKNTAATVATIIVAVLAVAATLFLLYRMSQEQAQESRYDYVPSDEVGEEMNINAVKLIQNNCEVFRIYLQYGLAHKAEPYNNLPEDGYYTVTSDKYSSMSEIEELVNSTFVTNEAERILTNVSGDGVAVFAEEINDDGEKGIGLDMSKVDEDGRFKAIQYGYSWSNAKFTLHPVSDTECEILVELNPLADSDESAQAGDTKKLTASMIKVNGEWRLEKLVY